MALYDPEAVRAFYNAYGDREWDRLDRPIGRVHRHVTMNFLRRYVPAGSRVLDAGCGPGRFAIDLLQRGCRVTLVDVSDEMIAQATRRIAEAGVSAGVEAAFRRSLLDLRDLPEGGWDAAVCLGAPLNYMPERLVEALSVLRRLLRPGGVLVAGVMNTCGTFRSVIAQGWVPADDQLDAEGVLHVWRTGALNVDGRWISEHRARMFSAEEWRDALRAAGLQACAESATECLLSLPADRLEALEADPAWPALLEAEVLACGRLPESGPHMLSAARRPAGAARPEATSHAER